MISKRLALILAGLLILASLAACSTVPPITQAPAAQPSAAQPSAATVAPAATDTPAPMPTPAATPTPAIPDAKADAQAALLYASSGKLFKTAEFTYTTTMTMAPADDASAAALGTQADELKNFKMEMQGSGAMEVTDAAAMKSKMRMDMDINAVGQQMQLQMILIDQTAWVKATGQDAWQKVEGDQVQSLTPGVSPEKMLEDFANAVDVQWIEDVTQGSETVSHLRFTMDPSKLDLGSLTASATGSSDLTPEQVQAMVKDMKPVVDVWLTKPTLELRGEKMTLDFVVPLPEDASTGNVKIRAFMTMDMQFSKVNEPVTIEPPTE